MSEIAGINTSSNITTNNTARATSSFSNPNLRRREVQPLVDPNASKELITSKGQKTSTTGTKTESSGGAKSAAIAGGMTAISAIQNISNVQSAYDALKEQNKINALELDRAEGILIQQSRQSMLDLKRQGEENSVQAQLALAAQGQNLNSAGAQKVSNSYETMGIYDAMIEEVNLMRSVYDINFQRIEMKRAEGLARAQKKNAVFSGIVSTAASAVGGYFGGTAGAAAAGGITSSLTSEDFAAE